MMRKFKLKCRIITPLFMGGANQQAELRTQSINGVIRWWFRVLGGSFEDEKRLFGWGGEGANQGLVRMSLCNFDNSNPNNCLLAGKNGEGIKYLGFSLIMQNRSCIDIDTTFDLIIRFHPKATDEDIKKFFSALWCAFNLGNFGSRSRRGFGSIMVEEVEGELPEGFQLEFKPNRPDKWIKQNLRIIEGLICWKPREDIPYVFKFEIYKVNKNALSNLNRWVNLVQRGRRGRYRGLTNWEKLIDFMGFLLMAFRSYRNPDYLKAKNILQGMRLQDLTFERPIFGLPLNFYFWGRTYTLNLKKGNETLRRSSPLMFKILKVNNSYEGLFIVAKSKFMPKNSRLDFQGITVNLPQNEWKALDEFISSLQKNGLISKIK